MNMKVLWFTNLPIGEAPSLMGVGKSVFGGWLEGLFGQLASLDDIALSVAFPSPHTKMSSLSGLRAKYHPFPSGPSGMEPASATVHRIQEILDIAKPDIVHVFGTELQHSVAVMRLCREHGIPALLQMQGLMGSIAQHYMGWLPEHVTRRATPVEVLRGRTLGQIRRSFFAAAELESQALRLADHVLGRTTYDRGWAQQVNPAAMYHAAEETLRDAFYKGEWSMDKCERFTLFVSQAVAPYKGAHMAIRALPIILNRFPRTRLLIAGPNPIGGHNPRDVIRRTSYGWYLRGLIRKLGLVKQVHFVGSLDENTMREHYFKSHVFLSCSSVENESNSVSEAKMLGVPVVASYVGGVPDRVEHGITGYLYQGDAPYMLAHFVTDILADDALAAHLGSKARTDALSRHDRVRNLNRILEIYSTITGLKHEAGRG